MMKIASLAAAVSLVVCTAGAVALAADEKADVNGTWDVLIDIGGQQGKPVFTFKQDGDKLSGKYKGQFGEADVTGKLKGNEIEFSFEAQGAKIVYTGKVDKDTMKGTADYAGQATGEWTAKKQAK